MRSDGSGDRIPALTLLLRQALPMAWHREELIFGELAQEGSVFEQVSIGAVRIEEGVVTEGRILIEDAYNASLSPNGRWIAYQSGGGEPQVWVKPFPDVESARIRISTDGGRSPVWGPDGQELFFLAADAMMRVEVEVAGDLRPGRPDVLFRGDHVVNRRERPFDIHPDGQRFLMIKRLDSDQTLNSEIVVVTDWFEELERLVPTD